MLNVKVAEPNGTIIIDRSERCNALTRELTQELSQAFDDLRQEKKVRGIILTGAGAHFCTGRDVSEMHETLGEPDSAQRWFEDAQAIQSLLEEMLRCPKPIVAAVDGAAQGAGLALVLASDLVVASYRARFSVPAPKLGLVSGLTIPLLTFRGGAALASNILLGGAELSAAEAKDQGMVHHVVDPEQVWVRASTWIDRISESAAESIQLTKKVLNEMVGEQISTLLSSGAAATATSLTTEAAKIGISAFLSHSKPEFVSS